MLVNKPVLIAALLLFISFCCTASDSISVKLVTNKNRFEGLPVKSNHIRISQEQIEIDEEFFTEFIAAIDTEQFIMGSFTVNRGEQQCTIFIISIISSILPSNYPYIVMSSDRAMNTERTFKLVIDTEKARYEYRRIFE